MENVIFLHFTKTMLPMLNLHTNHSFHELFLNLGIKVDVDAFRIDVIKDSTSH